MMPQGGGTGLAPEGSVATTLPASPAPFPQLPPPAIVSDLGLRPTLPMPPPRTLACNPLGSVFGVAS